MLEFRKILFPVDFSPACMQTAPYVAAIARKFQSETALLHVFDINRGAGYGTASSAAAYAVYEEEIREHRVDELECFAQYEFDGLKVARTVEAGDPAGRIVHYADEHEIDLIIMPTHGQGRFRKLLLGSVTAKVLHDTERPVWTTAHSEALTSHNAVEIQQVICAVDLSQQSPCVIRAASEIADRYGVNVKLVHAIPLPEWTPSTGIEEPPFQRFLFDTANELLADLQRETHTNFDVSIIYGKVAPVIRDMVLSCGAQLTIIGRGHMTELLGRLRSNVGAIIRESPCPVLSV